MKIFGIGMNYPAHNEELDGRAYVTPDPVVFTKADSALLRVGDPFFVPDYTREPEYEAELVVRISRLGRSIPERFAHRYFEEVTVGIDFTARDLQREARRAGLPWTIAKGFDGSAAIGRWVRLDALGGDADNLHFRLDLNGQTVQAGYTGEMTHRVARLVSYISQFFTLKTGDLIYTGTPAGVGAVHIDDHLDAYLEGRHILSMNVK